MIRATERLNDAGVLTLVDGIEAGVGNLADGFEIRTLCLDGERQYPIAHVPRVTGRIPATVCAIRIGSPILIDGCARWCIVLQSRDPKTGDWKASYSGVPGLTFQNGADPRALFEGAFCGKRLQRSIVGTDETIPDADAPSAGDAEGDALYILLPLASPDIGSVLYHDGKRWVMPPLPGGWKTIVGIIAFMGLFLLVTRLL